MTAPPLLIALIGQDVVDKCGFLPLIYAIYGAAAMLALRSVKGAKTWSRRQGVLPNDPAETVTTNNASATDSCRRIHRMGAFRRRERLRKTSSNRSVNF
jgi:hypothetical protein